MSVLSLNYEIGIAGDFKVEYDSEASIYLIIAQDAACECTLRLTREEAIAVARKLMDHANPK